MHLISLFPNRGDPAKRFTVDDVPVSTERLPMIELVALMRRKIAREVLLSPQRGTPVVAQSNSPNPLVGAVHLAFSRHLPVTLSPDVIWLTIAQGFSHH